MLVMKFGGSSVSDAERIKGVCNIIANKYKEDNSLFVVVSAFGGMTDTLIKISNLAADNDPGYTVLLDKLIKRINDVVIDLSIPKTTSFIQELEENQQALRSILIGVALIQEASFKTRDYILSFGERNSAYIISKYLETIKIPSQYIDTRNYIKTDNSFGSAIVNFEHTNDLLKSLNNNESGVRMITGFIGSDLDSYRTTTLGRGGSDYTAAIFAAALKADHLEIWTDVNGVLTSDPRKVKNAYTIPEMSYSEALEMSHFGAKVLYAPTIRPVRQNNIPTKIKNTFCPDQKGTLIHNNTQSGHNIITGLSSIEGISIISIQGPGLQGVPGIASRFFSCLAKGKINIIMITQASSEHSISVAIKDDKSEVAVRLIEVEFEQELIRKLIEPIIVESKLSLLAVIGQNMKNQHGVAGKLFNTLGKNGINIEAISQGSSELNITFAIKSDQETRALNTIHDSFFLSEFKTVHLFIVGIGLIGSKLIELLEINMEHIKKSTGLNIVINGLSNSKKILIKDDGIPLSSYKEVLSAEGQDYNLPLFVDQMIQMNMAHSIFIDNTANSGLPAFYYKILDNNIAISTPNKIAMSSDLSSYKALKSLALRKNTPLKYETNVAAGLPVISTLENLINSGDELIKIEAVLSGSLSYIFNSFSSSESSFADIIRKAQEMGLTEPDPREDLSGADVKRKLLILAREAGFDIEETDIQISSFLSEESLSASSVEAFLSVLDKEKDLYKEKLMLAQEKSLKLRFIAEFSEGKGLISLKAVDDTSPFYSLSGSDNMIVFHSQRYNQTPLVVRGPGAGADVTAAGVLAEIINLGNVL